MRIHNLRHSFASLLISGNKAPINVVSQILGHSKVSTTLGIYTHTDTELQKEAVMYIDSVIG